MLGVVDDLLFDSPVGLVGRVVPEDVEDEPLLDGLPHRIEVKRDEPVAVRGGRPFAEEFEGLGLRSGREREEGDVVLLSASGDRCDELVFSVTLSLCTYGFLGFGRVQCGRVGFG